jgi:hypothetical protein
VKRPLSNYQEAIALCGLLLFEDSKDKRCVAMAANNIAQPLLKMQRFGEALPFLRRCLSLSQEIGHTTWVVTTLGNFAYLACGLQQFRHAVLLLSLQTVDAPTRTRQAPF